MTKLPDPLKLEEQNRLLNLLPSKEARELLISTNLKYVLSMARKYSVIFPTIDEEDFFQ